MGLEKMKKGEKVGKALYKENGEYNRIFEIDFLRGLCILLVMVDHLLFNFAVCYANNDFLIAMNLFGRDYWYMPIRVYTREVVVAIFFILSGISSSFSKNNVMRGLKMLAVAISLTVITKIAYIFTQNPYTVIEFGAIHVFACCILIYACIEKLPKVALFVISAILVYAHWFISALDIQTTGKWLLAFGVAPAGYQYGDWFSLFPWTGFFILGGVLGGILYKERKSLIKIKPKLSKPILHIGRKSLYYYFGEMILLMPIFYLLTVIFGY